MQASVLQHLLREERGGGASNTSSLLRAEPTKGEQKIPAPQHSVQDLHAFVTDYQVRPEGDSEREEQGGEFVVVQMLKVPMGLPELILGA